MDVKLEKNPAGDSLRVFVRANGNSFDQVVSGITLTIRYDTVPGVAGPFIANGNTGRTQFCNFGYNLASQAFPVPGAAGFRHKTYTAFGTSPIFDPNDPDPISIGGGSACPDQVWTANTWRLIARIRVFNHTSTNCRTFEVSGTSDAFAVANNLNWFVSLNGVDLTGSFVPPAVQFGNCVTCVAPQITSTSSNSPICSNQTLNLGVVATGTAPLSYTWTGTGTITNGGSPNATVTGAATGNYNIAVSNACGSVNQNVAVTVNTAATWFQDQDGDGFGDPNNTQLSCTQPTGFVANNTDNCPTVFGLVGSSCNDGNACTINDVLNASCVCVGTFQDTDGDGICNANDNCPTVPGQQGSACNDGNACTINDVLNASCVCVGTFQDTDGDGICNANDNCPNLPGQQGDACNDNNACTINDVINASCVCAGTFQDTDGDGICNANDNCPNLPGQQGDACNDGNACTINDVINASCVCAGTFQDTDGDGICNANDNCPTVPGQQGDACNDNNACTINDVINASCVCVGTFQDTDGDGICNADDDCPTVTGEIGSACNDGDACTTNDVLNASCVCAGTFADADGDGTCDANDQCPGGPEPGTSCNDGNPLTINDVIGANCLCAGAPVSCVVNGDCNDNNPCTSDACVSNNCVYTPLPDADNDGICDAQDDCPNLAGEQGDACNDNNACTINDVINASCVCVGTFQDTDGDGICNADDDCPTVPGEIGSACSDGNACTINDVLNASCVCVGTFQDTDGDGICNADDDCPTVTGEIGSACNDNNACTVNDVLDANCVCAGTFADADGDGTCDANDLCPGGPEPGSACNDNNACTVGDIVLANCTCAGTFADADGDGTCDANDQCPGGPEPGTACDDGNALTINDVIGANCLCAGAPVSCVVNGDCNDNNPCTSDACVANTCVYTPLPDGDGDGICDAQDDCPTVAGEQGDACNDNNACTINDVLDANCQCVGTPITVTATCNHTDVTCFGLNDGTVTVTASGGTGPYSGTGTFTGLAPNTYTYTVSDFNGCQGSCTSTITQPTALTVGVTTTPVTSIGGSDGTATANVSGGALPYGFDWSPGSPNGDGTNFISALTAGTYSVVVTDDNGCTANASGTVNSPACNLSVSISHTDVQCFGGSDGTATANVTGATLPVTYLWSPGGATTQSISGLTAGTYTVNILDGANCPGSATQVIGSATQVVLGSSVGAFSCGTFTAPVTISATGGALPYTGTGTFNQAPGTTTYTVSDGNNCQSTIQVTVTAPDADNDGTSDCTDGCPNDPNKIAPGQCGCGNPDTDTDNDGTADCNDLCPADPNKTAPGICGCGVADTDSDNDGTADCLDLCPNDPNKIAPGQCGCGVADTDTDLDGVADCVDNCPAVANASQADTDGDDLGDACDPCPLGANPGSACNDNNPGTINDVIDANCQCVGTPVSCVNWTLTINTDGAGSETTWQIVDANSPTVLGSGGPYPNNVTVTETICIPFGGCFNLIVNDAGNNGISGGGYVLRNDAGERVIDNAGNGGNFTSVSQAALPFCSPLSNDRLIASQCDVETWIAGQWLIASANAAVSAQFGVGDQTDDGYDFWFFNPNGGYSRRIFISHAAPMTGAPAGATAAAHLRFSNLLTNPVPSFTLLNVRVRTRVNGVIGEYGPACRFRIDPVAAQCPTTQLDPNPGTNFSCGATGKLVNGTGNSGRIWALPVTRVVSGQTQVANRYQFEFSIPAEGYFRNIQTTSYTLLLSVWSSNPLLCGTYTYNVRVRASFDGGTTWCPWGASCTVGITNNQPAPFCTQPGGNLWGNDNERVFFDGDPAASAVMTMWPNPNRGDQLFITIDQLNADVTTATVDIFDLVGRKVTSRTIPVNGATLNTVIGLEQGFGSGMYLVNVTAGEQTFTQRLVIQ